MAGSSDLIGMGSWSAHAPEIDPIHCPYMATVKVSYIGTITI